MEGWLIFAGIISIIGFISWVVGLQDKAKKYEQLKPRLDSLDSYNAELETKKSQLINKEYELARKMRSDTNTIEILVQEKTAGFPWLAEACSEYFYLQSMRTADYLQSKSHPAPGAAENMRQVAKECREAEKAARMANYLLDYCRYLAPWLDEYVGLESKELDGIIREIHSSWEKKEKEFDEEVRHHFGPRYEGLSATEKLQRKLDWYWEKPNKSDWQIGRDYERYIGFLYEAKGWRVYYHGKKGYEDLGRDLICKKGNVIEIIQCKRWAQKRIIHEKHIYYLFGTTVEYFLENFGGQDLQLALFPDIVRKRNVVPKLVTTAGISPKAEQVARVLGVMIDKIPSERYPSVKCNISRSPDDVGERIFHLPFDQQYDTTLIEEERLECYVSTVAQAESLGFRHAYRWKREV